MAQPDVFVLVCDLCLTAVCAGRVATGTALGTTTGAAVATGTGMVMTGTAAAGTEAACGSTGVAGASVVCGAAIGSSRAMVGVVSSTGTVTSALLAEPVPDCQPIAATMVNSAVAEAPAVMIFEERAGVGPLTARWAR